MQSPHEEDREAVVSHFSRFTANLGIFVLRFISTSTRWLDLEKAGGLG